MLLFKKEFSNNNLALEKFEKNKILFAFKILFLFFTCFEQIHSLSTMGTSIGAGILNDHGFVEQQHIQFGAKHEGEQYGTGQMQLQHRQIVHLARVHL